VKLQLMSDLHLERNSAFQPQAVPGVDLLVLAGDIGSYQAGSRLGEHGPEADWGLGRFAQGAWPQVIYVPGNHEYDGLPWPQARDALRACAERLGMLWLDREVRVIQGVRFIGCTLWADFDLLVDAKGPMAAQIKARLKAFKAANFYLRKFSALGADGQPLLAESMRELALADQTWLREALQQPFEGKTVVITHFAPSGRSADPRYGATPGTAGFCNALDDLLPLADLWLHGHLHCPHDYVVGRCRVVANPLGYASKGEQDGFLPGLVLDV
jgi:predicted phosphodiesterase